jgi:predicted RNA-binding Zn-ribbon protein involved in translation (DUF1610 family)
MESLNELFSKALGIEEPVFIEKITFGTKGNKIIFGAQDNGFHIDNITFGSCGSELHIHLDFNRSARFTCPQCGALELPPGGAQPQRKQYPDFFGHECHIIYRLPYKMCPKCGKYVALNPYEKLFSIIGERVF